MPNSINDTFRLFHPVKRCIAEDGIEPRLYAKIVAIHDHHSQTAVFRCSDLGDAGVDAKHGSARSRDFMGQGAVADILDPK